MTQISGANNKTKIWIDLDNSPHIPFFYPIIKELNDRGFSSVLTARNCYQVCGLVDLYHLDCSVIGKHYGKNKLLKIWGMLHRSFRLVLFARKNKPALAVSHGSRAQCIAASLLGMRSIVIIDYEHGQKVPFINPDLYIVPEVMKNHHPWPPNTVRSYPGIKEDVYVPFFKPDPSILKTLGLHAGHILVTIRPPASEAHYHDPQSDVLFAGILDCFGERNDVQMVILPRSHVQEEQIRERWSPLIAKKKVIIPGDVVNGLNLMWHSDLIISGGGTMNREAAALGVPVYSIFRGKIGAVDRYLSETGRLNLIEHPDDIQKKILLKRRIIPEHLNSANNGVLQCIVDVIVKHLERH
jgi:predicted glycosyltransferase